MKKIFLFTLILITSLQLTIAQNTIAKLKYEEAEEAYANNNFNLTISKLKEVEVLLKSTNPKVLYLKILAESRIIENTPEKYCPVIEDLKPSVAKYLKEYENVPNNEDKYREVYKISEKINNYPGSQKDFEDQRNAAELNKKKKDEEAFMSYVYVGKIKMGISLEEAKKAYPGSFTNALYKDGIKGDFYYSISGPNFWFKNEKLYAYSKMERFNDDGNFTKGAEMASSMVNDLTERFNFKPTLETPKDHSTKGIRVDAISYVWEKNNKKIIVTFSKMWQSKPYPIGTVSAINVEQYDNYLVE